MRLLTDRHRGILEQKFLHPPCWITGAAEEAKPYLASLICRPTKGLCVYLCPDGRRARACHQFLCAPLGIDATLLPEDDRLLPETFHHIWKQMQDEPHSILVTSVQAALHPWPSPKQIHQHTLEVKKGMELARNTLAHHLTNEGYVKVPVVEDRGEFAVRGSVVDCYVPGGRRPIRVEFYGDTVESIRKFNAVSQRTEQDMTQITIWPNRHLQGETSNAHLLELIHQRQEPWHLVIDEPVAVTEALPADRRKAYTSFLAETATFFLSGLPEKAPWMMPKDTVTVPCSPMQFYAGNVDHLAEELDRRLREDYTVYLVAPTKAEMARFHKMLEAKGISLPTIPNLQKTGSERISAIMQGELRRGFICEDTRTAFISDGDIFRRLRPRPPKPTRFEQRIENWSELKEGDFVVHIDYGIGRFQGLASLKVSGRWNDYFQVNYKGSDRLYVPIGQIDRLHKYVGTSDSPPQVHTLEGAGWSLTKKRVHEATEKLAQSALKLHTVRAVRKGFAFSPDTPWQWELEASFPYEETPDQLAAIRQVKKDMESKKIMDHLLCGDSGYGKTEVAVRASFKAVMDSKQVAVLVPTTILAEQHFNTFCERMRSFPVHISMLSRFQSLQERKHIVAELAQGTVDIVVGTHRLLQKDIRFKDLGLVVIDEEHRFGVRQKGRLKQLHNTVDVLSLSATPIPRSLQMALSGLYELSTLDSAPRERQNVAPHVAPYSAGIVREAITTEMQRGGQVFYLYNRIADISFVAERIQNLVPDLRVAVAHGRMPPAALESTIAAFLRGEVDALLCTSIIESGVDMPNVNTIVVENAGQFGLADLYQLKGRVGRRDVKGHAYLLYHQDERMNKQTKRRLQVIRQFTGSGTGLKIALEDLHLRGAGNLLGKEQHGHISAVGFTLYTQLLTDEVKRLKDQQVPPRNPFHVSLGVETRIPSSYVPSKRLRTQLYRRIGDIRRQTEVDDFAGELRDRFGPLPLAVSNLVELLKIKLRANTLGLLSITRTTNNVVHFKFSTENGLYQQAKHVLRQELEKEVQVSRKDATTLICRGLPSANREQLPVWLHTLLQKAEDMLTLTRDRSRSTGSIHA